MIPLTNVTSVLLQGNDAMGAVGMVIYAVFVIAMLAGWWMVFTKAGEPGWAAIIPIYNVYVMLKLQGRPGWWILLLLIPLVNFVVIIMIYHGISLSFGRGAGTTIGLFLLPFVFVPMLGFGDAQYLGPKAA